MKAHSTFQGSVSALLLATVAAGAACAPTASPSKVTSGGGGSQTTGKGGSSGGTTTGAGGTTGGTTTGGTGGTTVTQKLCATKTALPNPVLINFETYTGSVAAENFGAPFGVPDPNINFYPTTGPYSYGDGSVTPMLAILAGHPPSQWAVSQMVTQARTWGMGGGLWMTCANASMYKGISFWVRGSGPLSVFSFTLVTENTVPPDAANPAGGGTCPGTGDACKPATKADIPLTMDWTQVQILWADFAPGMSGTTAVVPNGDNITGLGWSVPLQFQLDPAAQGDANGSYIAVPGDLVINIDDVSFIQ